MSASSRLGTTFARNLHFLGTDTTRILTIGGASRLGEKAIGALRERTGKEHTFTHVVRKTGVDFLSKDEQIKMDNIDSITKEGWEKILKDSHAEIVLNMASASEGSYEDIQRVNVHLPKNLVEAAQSMNIKVIQFSSQAILTPGLTKEETPYAYSKREAEEVLKQYDNVIIVRLGAVLGGKSEVPVCSDAAVAYGSPFVLLPPEGGEQTIRPVTIDKVKDVLVALVEKIEKGEKIPQVIDVAGKKITLEAFLKMVNPFALGSVKIPKKVIDALAKLVDKGVFTKEFMRMSKLMADVSGEAEKPDLSSLRSIGVEPPTPEEVAIAARAQLSLLRTIKTVAKPVLTPFYTVADMIYKIAQQALVISSEK